MPSVPPPEELPSSTATIEVALNPLPLQNFTNTGACSNLFLYAVTGDGRGALLFDFKLGEVMEEESVVDASFDLPDPNVSVTFQSGSSLDEPLCNDLFGPDFRVDSQLLLTQGHVTLAIDRIGLESGQASVRVTNLGDGTDSGLSFGDGELRAQIGTGGG